MKSRQKSESIETFNTTNHLDLIDILRTLQQITAKHFFFQVHEIVTKIDHKLSLKKFQKIEMLQTMLSDASGIKLDIINNKKKLEKFLNYLRTEHFHVSHGQKEN